MRALLAVLFAAVSATAVQDGSETELDRYVRLAREGSPIVRPQAARRLVRLGRPAAERLLVECGEGPRDMGALGADLVEVLGELDDARLRAKLWQALEDKDFPWRPSAARSLASTARAAEADRYHVMATDHLSAVRTAAMTAFERADLRQRQTMLLALLQDPHDRVRREAARVLDAWGNSCMLAYLVEDLRRDDRFFQLETGKEARFAAIAILERRFGDRFGYRPEQSPRVKVNRDAIEAIDRKTRELCWGGLPELPAIARAGRATEGDLIGLEVRSCRRGEFFLRWSRDDVLYVGTGRSARVQLPEGTVARLAKQMAPVVEELSEEAFWGAPGCDWEVFYWQPDPEARPVALRISKGPDAVPGLRPGKLAELAARLVATVPENAHAGDPAVDQDPRLLNLRANVAEALRAVGGELP
ncbi:MAG: hypothetical protein O7B99_13585 [Planctomycetota bacterium]|nr:hypothetical protein [Planctomycetota bacterium]